MMGDYFKVLGVRISAVNLDTAWDKINAWVRDRIKTYVCIAPVSTVVHCQDDPEYFRLVNEAGMVTPDGMPLVWLGRRQGYHQVRRTYGPELMPLVCARGQALGLRHFFYGATEDTLQKLSVELTARYPDIRIAGVLAPPFHEMTKAETASHLEAINISRADIVWVGLGSPKQDYWIARHRAQLDAPVLIGIGAAFDFLAGVKRQAPGWMRRSGLEWFFRLLNEPRRLWRRYLLGNTRFMILLITDGLFRRGGRQPAGGANR